MYLRIGAGTPITHKTQLRFWVFQWEFKLFKLYNARPMPSISMESGFGMSREFALPARERRYRRKACAKI